MLLLEKDIIYITYVLSETWKSNSGSISISGSDTHVEATYTHGTRASTVTPAGTAVLQGWPVVALLCAGPGCASRAPIMSRVSSHQDHDAIS